MFTYLRGHVEQNIQEKKVESENEGVHKMCGRTPHHSQSSAMIEVCEARTRSSQPREDHDVNTYQSSKTITCILQESSKNQLNCNK